MTVFAFSWVEIKVEIAEQCIRLGIMNAVLQSDMTPFPSIFVRQLKKMKKLTYQRDVIVPSRCIRNHLKLQT